MKINVLFSPLNVEELYFTGKTTVVIDILRATSTIVNAIANGAREIVPVNTVEFAKKVSGGQSILGGERNTKKIEGFTLGNSPLEYIREIVEGKSIILFTSNGTKAIVKAKFSETLIPASFNNLTAVAKFLAAKGENVEILCAGADGMFCIEDTVCAGKIIEQLLLLRDDLILSDAAKASLSLADSFGSDIRQMLADSEHGKLLISNDFEADLDFCAQIDNFDIVPVFADGAIKLLRQDKEKH